MADKGTFVQQFRSQVIAMLDAGEQMTQLLLDLQAYGWDQDALEGQFASSDISSDDFWGAITAVQGLVGQYASVATILTKLRR